MNKVRLPSRIVLPRRGRYSHLMKCTKILEMPIKVGMGFLVSMEEKEGERERLATGMWGWPERKFTEEEISGLNFKKIIT